MRKLSLTLFAALLAVAVTACGSNGNNAGSGGNNAASGGSGSAAASPSGDSGATSSAGKAPAAEKPVSFSWSTLLWDEPPNVDKSPFYQELFKRLNAKIDYEFVPSANYSDKINLALSSNALADVTTVKQTNETTIVSAIRQGAFWDLSSLLGDFADYPNLAKIPQDIYDFSKVDGKIYGIPNTTGDTAIGIVIRKDWLDRLNLQMPTTLAEFENVLKAFATQDPDNNGKNDTIPLGVSTETMEMAGNVIAASFGVNKPQFEDDRMLLTWMTPAYADYLENMRNWYAEGLLPKEFPVLKFRQEIDLFKQGTVGAFGVPIQEVYGIEQDLKKNNPNAQLAIMAPMQGKAGYTAYNNSSGYYGAFMIPKSVPEDKAVRILHVLDQSASDEINELYQTGVEGADYKVENGQKVVDAEAIKKDVGVAYTIVNSYDKYKAFNSIAAAPEDAVKGLRDMLDQYQAKMGDYPMDPFSGLISDTNNKRSADLFKDLTTNEDKTVMGKMTMDDWNAYVQQMKQNSEVQQIMKEFADQYKLKNPG